MEIDLELVERLREKTDYTYEEARAALERNEGDLLDAVIEAEQHHRTRTSGGGTFTTQPGKGQKAGGTGTGPQSGYGQDKEESGEEWDFSGFFRRVWQILNPMQGNVLEVWRETEKIVAVPLLVLLLGLIAALWIVLPLLVVGLVLGCRYRLTGPDVENTGVSRGLDALCHAVQGLRDKMTDHK